MRKFILYIDEEVPMYGVYDKEFGIDSQFYGDKKRTRKYNFATFRTKNNKAICFFDMYLNDEAVEISKKDKIMAEICEFEILINDVFKEKRVMSLSQALKYLREAEIKNLQ